MILVADIHRAVAAAHKVSVEIMHERDGLGSRNRDHVWPRQEAMFLCRTMIREGHSHSRPLSLTTIGRRFGSRDHTTVIHALRAVTERIASDADVRRRIDAISVGLLI
jgi:chromosomal replication initiator protein